MSAPNSMLQRLRSAMRAAVPIVGINTPDQFATIAAIKKAVNGADPIVRWDLSKGWQAINEAGAGAIQAALQGQEIDTSSPDTMLSRAELLPENSILIMMSAHAVIENPVVRQGIANLRDPFKSSTRMLILLAPELQLPSDLTNMIIMLDEALPERAEILKIVSDCVSDAIQSKLLQAAPNQDELERAADSLVGLAAFPAEQSAAMSITKTGLDVSECWERKFKLIEQTPGLQVDRSSLTFNDLGGLQQIVKFGRKLAGGRRRPKLIVRVDEIDKLMAGVGGEGTPGDTSGTSQDQLGVVLSGMEGNKHRGLMAVGPPGSGKTLFSQALGGELDIPTLSVDFGAAKGGIVGQSEAMIRALFKTVVAMAGSEAYWIATCNKLDGLPPALRRRFTHGVWYFDLPTLEEQAVIWNYHGKRLQVDVSDKALAAFNWSNWTGAEIRNCAELAWDLDCSLAEASKFIVPVAVSDPASIEKLRDQAAGKFNSASYEGYYRRAASVVVSDAPGRTFRKGE